MAIRTVLTAHPGNTVMVYLSASPPAAYLVKSEDTKQTRRKKLRRQNDLYASWLESAQDPTKSPYFPNGQLSGLLGGYGGSLYFIEEHFTEEEGKPRLVFAHVFEDFTEQEVDPVDGVAFDKEKRAGLELARQFQTGKALELFKCKLSDAGFSDVVVRLLRFKQGGGI